MRQRASARDLLDRLRDERSRRVVFVSHCLLNENTRYAGGAFRPGAVPEIVEQILDSGAGISQMPCPEQRAWGGVLKRFIAPVYGSAGGALDPVRGALLRAFIVWTRWAYRRLARQVARDIADYRRSGFDVVGVVGVGASPSCGVATTLDLRRSCEHLAHCPVAALTREVVNEQAVAGSRIAGEGLFVRALRQQLARRRISVPFAEHDLLAEMRGEPQDRLPLSAADRDGSRG